MSSIFGMISPSSINQEAVKQLATLSSSRGKNLGGLIYTNQELQYSGLLANSNITHLFNHTLPMHNVAVGFTGISADYGNGSAPVLVDDIYAMTDSCILNKMALCASLNIADSHISDARLIIQWLTQELKNNLDLQTCIQKLLNTLSGDISAILLLPKLGRAIAFSNTNGLYYGEINQQTIIASEASFLKKMGVSQIHSIASPLVLDIPQSNILQPISEHITPNKTFNIHPSKELEKKYANDLSLLEYHLHDIKRCTRCILPETMPFITFDEEGVCNYCHNHKVMNAPKSKADLLDVVEPYRKPSGYECVVPFSGGRDSCYALHIIVNELKLRPVTYTYDWGMVTEVGQRNISRMCSKLGIENILVAADVAKKRKNVSMNLKAWLKKPDLGMLNILTAGDKHFFQYVDHIKRDNDIRLNLWGVNPLEVTHFKTGFLGIEPNFALQGVYARGAVKQLRYQSKRLKAMIQNPSYFNSSLTDTLSGEYYRSFTKKEDYYHVFDYWQWDEQDVEDVLNLYNWDRTVDSSCSWRIGDGVAGFYNYTYYTVAGFTEHDTFRSNQIREGQLTRDEALKLVQQENAPRYENLQWLFKVLDIDFNESIKAINNIPKLYKN